MAKFIEIESLSSKRWIVNVDEIQIIEEHTSFTDEEKAVIPELLNVKVCITMILRGRDETYWVKTPYNILKSLMRIVDEQDN